jgi:hypothetical protein
MPFHLYIFTVISPEFIGGLQYSAIFVPEAGVTLRIVSISFHVTEIHGNAKSRGVGGPAEKDLGRHRLRIDSGRSKTNKNLIFIDYESFP